MKKLGKLAANKIKFYTVLIAVILIAIIILRFAVFRPKNTEAEIISKSTLEKIIKVSATYKPNAENHAAYTKIFPVFKDLYKNNKKAYAALNRNKS